MNSVCEHEYENANCTNCANGLPSSAYECAKTKGTLKEYCHDRAEELHRQKYNDGYEQGYEQGRADVIDEFAVAVNELAVKWFNQGCIDLGDISKMAEELKGQNK